MKWTNIKQIKKEWVSLDDARSFDIFVGAEPRKTSFLTYYELKKRKYKDGWVEPYIARDIWCIAHFTILRTCHFCKKISTPKKIPIRELFTSCVYNQDHSLYLREPCCMKCYNKIKPIEKAHIEASKVAEATNQLRIFINKIKKIENNKEALNDKPA